MRMVLLAVLLAISSGCGFGGAGTAQHRPSYTVSNSHETRHAFGRHVRQLLDRQDYDRLEEMAAELGESNATAADGASKLRYFYKDGFDEMENRGKGLYPPLIEKLEAWMRARPSSVTAPVALAFAYIGYAWEARTGKYAPQVRNDQWELFRSRLEKAEAVLERAKTLPERCPCWYLAEQNLALGQGWPKDAYDALFAEAVAFRPDFDAYYEFKAMYLQTRWYGKPGEWQQFALESARALPDSLGARRYARIIWNLFVHHRGLIRDEAVDWPLARRGFEVLLREHPGSLETMSAYCFLASEAEDRETARRLFARIGGRVDLDSWVDPRFFLQYASWALKDVS